MASTRNSVARSERRMRRLLAIAALVGLASAPAAADVLTSTFTGGPDRVEAAPASDDLQHGGTAGVSGPVNEIGVAQDRDHATHEVPEPGTIALLAVGNYALAMLLFGPRRMGDRRTKS